MSRSTRTASCSTSAYVANLYTDGTTQLICTPLDVNTTPASVSGAFTITAVAGAAPEPATWGMMILGFGVVGFALRRRQQPLMRVSYAG